jgi:hypothetical protein
MNTTPQIYGVKMSGVFTPLKFPYRASFYFYVLNMGFLRQSGSGIG